MPLITDQIMKQMNRIGEPRVTTQESTLTAPQEGLDFGSIGLILAMLMGMNQGGPGAGLPDIATGGGLGGTATGSVGLGGLAGASPLATAGAPQVDPQTLQLLMSILGGGSGFGRP